MIDRDRGTYGVPWRYKELRRVGRRKAYCRNTIKWWRRQFNLVFKNSKSYIMAYRDNRRTDQPFCVLLEWVLLRRMRSLLAALCLCLVVFLSKALTIYRDPASSPGWRVQMIAKSPLEIPSFVCHINHLKWSSRSNQSAVALLWKYIYA